MVLNGDANAREARRFRFYKKYLADSFKNFQKTKAPKVYNENGGDKASFQKAGRACDQAASPSSEVEEAFRVYDDVSRGKRATKFSCPDLNLIPDDGSDGDGFGGVIHPELEESLSDAFRGTLMLMPLTPDLNRSGPNDEIAPEPFFNPLCSKDTPTITFPFSLPATPFSDINNWSDDESAGDGSRRSGGGGRRGGGSSGGGTGGGGGGGGGDGNGAGDGRGGSGSSRKNDGGLFHYDLGNYNQWRHNSRMANILMLAAFFGVAYRCRRLLNATVSSSSIRSYLACLAYRALVQSMKVLGMGSAVGAEVEVGEEEVMAVEVAAEEVGEEETPVVEAAEEVMREEDEVMTAEEVLDEEAAIRMMEGYLIMMWELIIINGGITTPGGPRNLFCTPSLGHHGITGIY